MLTGIYERNLKWAYEEAWQSDDPFEHIPVFREDVVSSSRYPIDADSFCERYIIWKTLFKLVRAAKMPLPRALRIVPRIVAMWNRRKGRIDEMTRLLEDMKFYIAQASPKQKLMLREIHKFAVSAYLASKHCFPAFW